MAQVSDDVTTAAEAAISDRSRRFQPVSMEIKPLSISMATMDDLTRIRFELTAIRQLLEKLTLR